MIKLVISPFFSKGALFFAFDKTLYFPENIFHIVTQECQFNYFLPLCRIQFLETKTYIIRSLVVLFHKDGEVLKVALGWDYST